MVSKLAWQPAQTCQIALTGLAKRKGWGESIQGRSSEAVKAKVWTQQVEMEKRSWTKE